MADVPQLALKEFFKVFAPTHVLGTTYTVSLAFFEGLIFPEIKRTNLRRCLLLCDKVGFRRATVESSALRSVGREYMAVCAPTRYSFHPKVWLMIGDGKAAILVGSGNLTQSGFSAVGYFFGRQLYQTIDVPIGLINNAWGGSACEAWVNRDLLKADPAYAPMARWALAKDYGIDIPCQSPRYRSMEKSGNTITLTFDHVGTGWRPFDVREPRGFAIAGEDKTFVWAQAKVLKDGRIEVRSEQVADPVAVRYGWADNPVVNMFNNAGLPLTPFRTDNWPGITVDAN